MVIFLLRHADRTTGDALSAAGKARARRLAQMLRDSKVGIAYCSDAARTRQTLAPLEELFGAALTVRPVSADGEGGIQRHIDEIAASLRAQPDETVAIVVSHSNTVGKIIEGAGGGPIDDIHDSEFDKLFVLVGPPTDEKRQFLLRY